MSGLSEAGSLRYAQRRSSLPKKRINNGDLSPPVIHLDSEGMILRMSDRVRQMLEYRSENSLPDCFLSLVHGRNLRQVMRDIGRMAAHHKKRADWLVRLQTGQSRWRWYRISAANRLGDEHGAIVMRIEGPVDCGFRW